MIADGWQTEAIELMESTREFQSCISKEMDKPDQFFKFEMQILNNSKTVQKSERYQRFYDLIDRDYNILETSNIIVT